MTRSIAPLLFAVGIFAAPATVAAQPPQAPPGNAPARQAADGRDVLVLSDAHEGGATADGRARNASVRRRTDGGVFVVNEDGTTYRLNQSDGGAIMLRAKDGKTYRVNGDSRRVFVLRAQDGGTFRVEGSRPVMIETALESCGGAEPLLDRQGGGDADRTRIVICSDREQSAAGRTARLERMLERIRHRDGLSDDTREHVAGALREAIEQLQSMR